MLGKRLVPTKPVSSWDLWESFFGLNIPFFVMFFIKEFSGVVALLLCADDDKTLLGFSMIDALHYCVSLTRLFAKLHHLLAGLSPASCWH